jgi:hypothetical protein
MSAVRASDKATARFRRPAETLHSRQVIPRKIMSRHYRWQHVIERAEEC